MTAERRGEVGLSDEALEPGSRKTVSKVRLEAFSDGVFAIAITLLVIELSIGETGTALERVLAGWPFYLAYLVSFLTIGAAWLAHTTITHNLGEPDGIFLRLNLLLLLFVSLVPFPTRLAAESHETVADERVYVAMYGLTLLAIRVLLYAVDEYAHREGLYPESERLKKDEVQRTIFGIAIAYIVAILVGLVLPKLAIGLYCVLAVYLVVPFRELTRLLLHRAR
jgi:uncharacterized membrane protein